MNIRSLVLMAGAVTLAGCEQPGTEVDPPSRADDLVVADTESASGTQLEVDDGVTGASLPLPAGWSAKRDPVLFDTHGFFVYGPTSGDGARGELYGGSEGLLEEPTPPTSEATCGFTAPNSLYWQLQWDETNTFYSGSWYNLAANPGWSAMSGNYGSWWGTNYHIRLCSTIYANQHYANDWPAQYWANAYAAFSGYVEWAGWGTDGFATLGNYVVVRNGSYRNVTAHLSGIAAGITWGAWVAGYWTVIDSAGSTGGPWAPHLHPRVSWGESLTYNGQPYGGQSVRPARLRCFTCKDQDVTTASGARYHNQFWHGRWMKY